MSRLLQPTPFYALRTLLCVLLASALLFAGCRTSDKPEDMMAESEYTELLMEVFITQNLIQLKELTEKRDSVMTDLFDRYGVTEDQFIRNHEYYQIQANDQKERIDRIRDRLREEREKIDKVRQEKTNTGRDLRTQPESSNRRP